MAINPLAAGAAASIIVLSVVSVVTMNDSKARHPERVSVAAAATAKPIVKPCADCGIVVEVKQMKKRYEILVRMSDGNLRILTSSTQPIWKAGDRVRLQNGKLIG
jgi:hypothetical protein